MQKSLFKILQAFDELKTPQLMLLANYLEISFKHSMRKQVIKNVLIDRLVDDDLFDDSVLDNKSEMDDDSENVAVKLKQLVKLKKNLKWKN